MFQRGLGRRFWCGCEKNSETVRLFCKVAFGVWNRPDPLCLLLPFGRVRLLPHRSVASALLSVLGAPIAGLLTIGYAAARTTTRPDMLLVLSVVGAVLGEVVALQRTLACALQRLVEGDLEADVTPRSAQDVHGVAAAALRQLLR